MSKTIDYPLEDGTTRRMRLQISQYVDNDNLYVGLRGLRSDDVIPLTVNINKLGYPYSTLDAGNLDMGRIVPWLEESGIARFTGQTMDSGYVKGYPVMAFNPEVLREADAKAFAVYQESHGFLPEKELDELAKEAKERAAEKNAERSESHKTTERKPPEMGR